MQTPSSQISFYQTGKNQNSEIRPDQKALVQMMLQPNSNKKNGAVLVFHVSKPAGLAISEQQERYLTKLFQKAWLFSTTS